MASLLAWALFEGPKNLTKAAEELSVAAALHAMANQARQLELFSVATIFWAHNAPALIWGPISHRIMEGKWTLSRLTPEQLPLFFKGLHGIIYPEGNTRGI